jgi:hypothetical protein
LVAWEQADEILARQKYAVVVIYEHIKVVRYRYENISAKVITD